MNRIIAAASLATLALSASAALADVTGPCATKNELSTVANDQASRMCAVYGFTPGTDAFNQCRSSVDRAIQRQAISSEATVNCTPMGKETVCQ
jgi:hypothetical protein